MIVIGHRGYAYEPENTLLSIDKAIKLGVNAVEIDVHLTKDNEIVVIHDDRLDRTTNSRGFVKDFTLEELKKLDAGKGERIPTLQEAVDLVNKKVKIIIELKEKNIEKGVLEIIEKNDLFNNCYVISFWHSAVKKIKELNKKIKTGILFVGCPVDIKLAESANADVLVMNYNYTDKNIVDLAHEKNLKVFVWNIDNKKEVKKYIDMGVDGVGSNKPEVIVGYLKKH